MIVMVPNPWRNEVEENYDFDVIKVDKLFDFLLEKGQIKLLLIMLYYLLIS